MERQHYFHEIVAIFRKEMGDNLVGLYLHGSLAMGCFHPAKSDIDFLVVAKEKLDPEIKKCIIKKLLALHDRIPGDGGLEMSILLERHLKPFIYPTPFELHYSPHYRGKYISDENYPCAGLEDKDLAAHIMVTYHRGIVLYGKPIKDVFDPIPEQYYIDSIISDVKNADVEIVKAPVYYRTYVEYCITSRRELSPQKRRRGVGSYRYSYEI